MYSAGVLLCSDGLLNSTVCVSHLFLVVEVHLPVCHFPAEAVHLLAELQPLLILVSRLVQLFGQIEVLPVQLSVLLG